MINNQGRGAVLQGDQAAEVLEILKSDAARSFDAYDHLLDEDRGNLARELARMALPLSTYTQWYWKIDLHNLFHFLALRVDPHAQYEIRVFADIMLDMVRDWVPAACSAFEDYRLGSFHLSAKMIAVVKGWLQGQDVSQENSGLSKREWGELRAALELD